MPVSSIIDRRVHVQAAEVGLEFNQYGPRAQSFVGYDQGALATLLDQVGGNQFARTGAEFDGGGEGEVGDGHIVSLTMRDESVALPQRISVRAALVKASAEPVEVAIASPSTSLPRA